jgi:ubiquinol-cytochrome c reductase cytochrome b subunit
MLFAILILFVLPLINTSEIRSTTFRPLFKVFLWILIGDFIFLGWVGQKPVRDTFVFVGQIATTYYFVFFTILVPLIGIVEKKLIRYPSVVSK